MLLWIGNTNYVQRKKLLVAILPIVGVVLVMLPFFIIGKSWLSPEQIVVANLGKDPLISMVVSSWGKQRVLFFMDKDGRAVWRNQRSPTEFCLATLSPKDVTELIDRCKKVEWGKNYSTSEMTDGPTCTVNFNGQTSSVYGGLGDHSNLLATLFTSATLTAARAKVNPSFLQLYDRLIAYDHPDAKPWLPKAVQLSLWSISPANGFLPPLPAGLPAVTKDDVKKNSYDDTLLNDYLGSRKELSPQAKESVRQDQRAAFGTGVTVSYDHRLDANKYKKQIIELVNISRQFNPRVVIAGEACAIGLNFDEELLNREMFDRTESMPDRTESNNEKMNK